MSGTSEDGSALLRAAVVAEIGPAQFAIPESMAYAGLAGLPPQAGLYGYARPIGSPEERDRT